MRTIEDGLALALARRRFGYGIGGEEIVGWATAALESHDTPSLRILAGLSPPLDEEEVGLFLRRAAVELGADLPTAHEQLAKVFAVDLGAQILAGAVSPEGGAQRLSELAAELRYPDWILIWLELGEAIDLARAGIFGTVAEAEAEIRREAAAMCAALHSQPAG